MSLSFRKVEYFKRRLCSRIAGRSDIHLLHIRKTGGTALKDVFRRHPKTVSHTIYTHPHRVSLWDIPAEHKVLFVLRDPVDRFLSGFGSRLRKSAPAHHVPWSQAEEKAFKHFGSAKMLARALAPSHRLHGEAKEAMSSITHLRSPYASWLGSAAELEKREVQIEFIGFVSSLNQDFQLLKDRLNLPEEVQLPTGLKAGNRSDPLHKQKDLDEFEQSCVKDWYSEDYEILEFCTAWRERNGGPIRNK